MARKEENIAEEDLFKEGIPYGISGMSLGTAD